MPRAILASLESSPRSSGLADGAARLAPGLVAVLFLLLWAGLVSLRVAYPFELEWMEGGMLDHVDRVRSGKPLYTPPSLEFGSYPYTPLFPWVGAIFAEVLGPGFVSARLVSILSTVVVLVLLGRLARAQANGRDLGLAALLSAGLYAAGNDFTGGWFDLARIDAVAYACGLGAFAVARSAAPAPRAIAAAAALAVLGCLGKQSLLALGTSVAASFYLRSWRHAAAYLAVFGALLVGTVGALEVRTDHWFRFWTFDILTNAPTHEPLVVGYWIECALALGPAILVVGLAMVRGGWRADLGMWCAAAALFVAGWAGRSHEGGFENNLIPPLLAAALFFGPAAARVVARGGARGALVVCLAFVTLAYDPRAHVPTPEDRRAGEELVERLSGLEPPLWMPDHGYLARRAFGSEAVPGIHGIMINDLLKSGYEELARGFVEELEEALAERRFGAVILDERLDADLPLLLENYLPPIALFEPLDGRFMPVNGSPKRPGWLYLRRD